MKFAVAALVVLVVIGVTAATLGGSGDRPAPSYGDFLSEVDAGQVAKAKMDVGDNSIHVTPKHGESYETAYPDNTEPALVHRLRAHTWT